MGEDELVRRILDEADMAARPGQYDRLVAIANEVAALREQKPIGTVEFIETGMVPRARAETRREVLADLRAKVESGWIPELDHEARIAVLALFEEADRG